MELPVCFMIMCFQMCTMVVTQDISPNDPKQTFLTTSSSVTTEPSTRGSTQAYSNFWARALNWLRKRESTVLPLNTAITMTATTESSETNRSVTTRILSRSSPSTEDRHESKEMNTPVSIANLEPDIAIGSNNTFDTRKDPKLELTSKNRTRSIDRPEKPSTFKIIRPTKPPGYVPLTDGPKIYRLVGTRKPPVSKKASKRRLKKKRKPTSLSPRETDTSVDTFRVTSKSDLDLDPEPPCPTCGHEDMTEEGVKNLRMQMFVDTLAKKMRMDVADLMADPDSAPKAPLLPQSLVEQMMRDTARRQMQAEDSFYAKDKEVIITGRDLGRDCISNHATGCYHFDLADKVKAEVASARLWWYKTRDRHDISGQTFVVYELDRARDQRLRRRNLILRKSSYLKEGWLSADMTRAVHRWLDKGRTEEMLAIRCKACARRNYKALYGSKEGYKPLLAITYAENTWTRRQERSVDSCNPVAECCKRPLIINFRRLGIGHIMAPTTLNINYCFGHCNQVNHHTYNHTLLKQRYRHMDHATDVMSEQLLPCCVPTNLMDSNFIFSSPQQPRIALMPNIIVDTCGCL